MVDLYSKNKSGKTLKWSISLLPKNDEGFIPIQILFGQLDGKTQTKIRLVKSGKNKGRSNETSIEQQAELELGYLVQKQKDSGYVESIEEYSELLRPQLAHKFVDKKHVLFKIPNDLPDKKKVLFGSRKLNGIRCFVFVNNGVVTKFESRTGKPFKFFTHIANCIPASLNNKSFILDGELFNKDIPFEVLCSLINSAEYVEVEYDGVTYDSNMVQFHVYDFVGLDNKFEDYFDRFVDNKLLEQFDSSISIVENIEIPFDEDIILDITRKYMEEGYEGLMLRSAWSSYEFGRRSSNLLKVKLFESDEFKIKDIYLAENDPTKVMFTLYNHFSKEELYSTFECSIKGNREYNMMYYLNKTNYINKWCTVPYQALSSYGVPLFAQIENIREGEEIDGQFRPNI